MKVIIDVNKDTSKLLTDLIDKMNSTKMSDLDKSRSKFESMIKELKDQLADSPEKDQLIEFFNEVIDDDEELVTIDKDPNIIDNKTLININTRKMNKKDLIKQELGEIESILKNKAYSQLLAKYQARVFSDIEGLEGEDIEELKERLDNISEQLEEISNTEAVSDESVEVTDEVTEEAPEEPEVAESEDASDAEVAEEVVEEAPAEEASEGEVAAEESSEDVKTESTDEEQVAEIADEAEESEKSRLEECMAELDEAMEELKEAVETKDFSKVIARHYDRLFSAVEEHQDLIENIDEVKAAMDDLAEKIEKLDAEADEDESDKKEGEEKEVEDAEHAEEASDEAHEEAAEETEDSHDETKTESDDDCWVLVKDGVETSTKGTKEEIKSQLDEFGPADRPHYEMKQCAKCCSDEEESTEVVTDEQVEAPVTEEASDAPNNEVPSEQEIKAIAEQAAEDAVYEQLENGLYMNEVSDETAAPEDASEEEALVSTEVPEKEAEVEPMYIDEKTEMVLDPMETEEVLTASDDLMDMEDEDLILGDEAEEADFCNKTFSRGTSQFLGEINTDKYSVASFEELMDF